MSKHVIFMYNSYFCKKKIALHYCDDNDKKYVEIIDIVKNKFPHINFNIHVVYTDSIYKADSYFDCTEFFGYDDYMEFIKLVERDVNIDAIDVAKVILCKKSLSHLENYRKYCFSLLKNLLQNMIYNYLKKNLRVGIMGQLFQVFIINIKKYGGRNIFIEDRFKITVFNKLSRFEHYYDLLEVIDDVLEEYKDSSPEELASTSHKEGGAWDCSRKNNSNIISWDSIKALGY